jgi:hypothetical protein
VDVRGDDDPLVDAAMNSRTRSAGVLSVTNSSSERGEP